MRGEKREAEILDTRKKLETRNKRQESRGKNFGSRMSDVGSVMWDFKPFRFKGIKEFIKQSQISKRASAVLRIIS